ncbi:hypothetical protein BH10BAC5_BH10BAC5_01500 [soil metagenome]
MKNYKYFRSIPVLLCILFLLSGFNLSNRTINVTEIQTDIKFLSSDENEGRFPGTKGDKAVEKYIIDRFKSLGLVPAGEKGYTQEFDITTGMKMGKNNTFSTSNDGTVVKYKAGTDFVPIAFSGKGIASGGFAFVGYGITAPEAGYDDYKDVNGNLLDLKGKILIMLRGTPPTKDPHDPKFSKYDRLRFKTLYARESGAVGIMYVNGTDGLPDDKLVKLSFDNALQDAGIPIISCKRSIAENIFTANGRDMKADEEKIGSSEMPNSFLMENASGEFSTEVFQEKAKTSNILGKIVGDDPVLKNEVIVIGAHRDHLGYGNFYGSLYEGDVELIHHGADDNASGTAGVLALAKEFASMNHKLKRTIVFMLFGAEEAGLLGSSYFTKSPLFKGMNVVSMINMDMIGRLADNKLIIYGTGTAPEFIPFLDEANKRYNFNTTYSADGYGPSDHSSFYSNDTPVLAFFTGLHSDYHKPSDTWDKINYEGEVKILEMVGDIARDIIEMPVKPTFTKVTIANNENQSLGGIKIYLGTVPDYSSNVEGLQLAGVKAGGPAEKGGLKANDIIIKFGKLDIKNIYDYTAALGEYKPGDEVDVVVKRGSDIVNLKIICGSKN